MYTARLFWNNDLQLSIIMSYVGLIEYIQSKR